MALETKYGDRLTIEGIPDDEPVFLFRAQDDLALEALYAYRDALVNSRLHSYAQGVDVSIAAFEAWQELHPDQVKNPD